MDNLAINSLLPVDAVKSQGIDDAAIKDDGKTFNDALSGLMGKRAGKHDKQSAEELDPSSIAQAEQPQDLADPAAEVGFMLTPLNAALATTIPGKSQSVSSATEALSMAEQKLPPEIPAEAIHGHIKHIADSSHDLPASALASTMAAAQASIPAESLKQGADPSQVTRDGEAPAVPHAANLPSTPSGREALALDKSNMLNKPELNQRQPSIQSVARLPAGSQEMRGHERPSPVDLGGQTMTSQQASLQGTASQLNAVFQPASPQLSSSAPAISAELIAPRVGASGWSEAMGQRIVMMASERIQQAELRLNPEGLGPLQVVLSLENGAADVRFVAHDPQVREALQSALPRLQEMLNSAGFSLDRVSVDSNAANNQASRENAESYKQSRNGTDRGSLEKAALPMDRVMVQTLPGRIDTFA